VEMTFRSGDLKRDKTSSLCFADLHDGQKVDGRIKKIEDYGLFVEIEGSKLSGLCHKSEVRVFRPEIFSALIILTFHYGSSPIIRTPMSPLGFAVSGKVTALRSSSCRSTEKNGRCLWA